MENENKDARPVEESENEGEGSKSADRQYRQDVEKFLGDNDPEALARRAAEDMERDPQVYEDAEQRGKGRSAGEHPNDKKVI